jgi:hypothetical protein
MPFTIQKNNKDEFCVFKKNENDEVVGESLGCHPSKKKAIAQIGAIESEEKRREEGKSVNYIASLDGNETFIPYTVTSTNFDVATGTYWTDSTVWYDQSGNLISGQFRDEGGGDVDSDLSQERKEKMNDIVKAHFESKEEAAEAAEELGCEGTHKMPDGSYMPCSKHEEFVELSGKKSIEITDVENLEAYIQDEDGHWILELDIELIKSFIKSEEDEPEIDPRYAIKTLGKNRIGSYGVLWGNESQRDLHREFFTKTTADMKAIFDAMGALPWIVHHAGDDKVKTFVVGEVDVIEEDDIGLWYEAKIKEFEAYRQYVEPFLKDNKMFSSSGTLPAAKRVNKDTGEITRWPIAEMTGTWLPAEYRMLERPISEIKSAYQELGHDVDLSEYEEQSDEVKDEADTKGVEKTRLNLLIEQKLRNLGLLEMEI